MSDKVKTRPVKKRSMLTMFRRKTLALFVGVVVLSASVTLIAYYLSSAFYTYYETEPGSALHLVRRMIGEIGELEFFILVFFALFAVLFFVVTEQYRRPLEGVASGIMNLAAGKFDEDIPVKANDEIAAITRMLNVAARRLRKAVENETFERKAKDRLVAGVAHDLRTPLTSVIGYLELIVNKDLTDAQRRRYAEIAYNKSRRLNALIDEVFEATRFRYGKLALSKTTIDLTKLTEQLRDELTLVFDAKGVVMRLKFAENPIVVEADGNMVARAVENLLNNALKYGADGKYVDVKLFVRDGSAYIQVINFGDPIPADSLPFIFEPFYRATAEDAISTGMTTESLGLGLSIVKDIAAAHGGAVAVESNNEKTTFEISLPCM